MHKIAISMGTAVLAGGIVVAAAAELAAQKAEGRALFVESGCQTCHSVSSAGLKAKARSARLKGPDLGNVGQRYEAEWIASYLRREAKMDGKAHKKEFKGTDEELQALVDWLREQKSE